MDKLKKVEANVLKATDKKIKTRIVLANFSHGEDIALYKRIAEEVKDLDIAVLVNNAGVLFNGYYKDITIQ